MQTCLLESVRNTIGLIDSKRTTTVDSDDRVDVKKCAFETIHDFTATDAILKWGQTGPVWAEHGRQLILLHLCLSRV